MIVIESNNNDFKYGKYFLVEEAPKRKRRNKKVIKVRPNNRRFDFTSMMDDEDEPSDFNMSDLLLPGEAYPVEDDDTGNPEDDAELNAEIDNMDDIDDYPVDDTIDDYPTDDVTDDYPTDDTDEDYPSDTLLDNDDYPVDDIDDDYPTDDTTDDYPMDDTDPGIYPTNDVADNPTDDTDYTQDPGTYPTDDGGVDPNAVPADPGTGNEVPVDQNANPEGNPPPEGDVISPDTAELTPGEDNTDFTNGADQGNDVPGMQGEEPKGPGIGYDSMRRYLLFQEYLKLLEAIDIYIEKLGNIVMDDYEVNKMIKVLTTKMEEIRKRCHDYLLLKFEKESYIKAKTYYEVIYVAVQLVINALDKVIVKKNNSNKK